jgi:phage head maturation protease
LDVSRQVVLGIDRGLIDEMSFAFLITRGAWSATWDEYRIYEYEIDRGDTSAVTYGANPYTEIDTERAHLTPPAPAGRTLSPREQQSARRVMAGLPPL